MKANDAPEKIYIRRIWGSLAASQMNITGRDIEYTRTDAFIEKACEFLSNEANIPLWEGYDSTFGCDTIKLIDNFKNYMKGE